MRDTIINCSPNSGHKSGKKSKSSFSLAILFRGKWKTPLSPSFSCFCIPAALALESLEMYVRVFFYLFIFFISYGGVFSLFCLVLLPPTYLSPSAVFRLFAFFDFVLFFFFAISLFFLPSQLRVSNDCFTLSYSC